jgi:hypothetical protein
VFNEEYYQQQVQQLKQKYPKIGRRVYKTSRKTWKQVYEERLSIIKGEPHPRTKRRRIELNE